MLVRHFAAAEAHGDLHLVAFLEEAADRASFHFVIVLVDVRTKLDLFQVGRLLLLACFGLLLLLGEALLAVVGNLHHRRLVVGRNHHQVEASLLGGVERCFERHLALLLAFLVNQEDARRANVLIDLRTFLLGRLGRLWTLSDGRSPW